MSRILVVDGDAGVREGLRSLFWEEGHNVVAADQGSEGLDVARSRPLDLVVCDLLLEDIDGLSLLESLRALRPGLPVVLLSGHPTPADFEAVVARGGFGLLPRPCDLPDMARVAHAALVAASLSEALDPRP